MIENQNKQSKTSKIIKRLFIALFSIIFIFFLVLFISSLTAYKESDFDIANDFFDVPHQDEINSEKNGFNDFVKFENIVGNTTKGENLDYEPIAEKESLRLLTSFYDSLFKGLSAEATDEFTKVEYYKAAIAYIKNHDEKYKSFDKEDEKIELLLEVAKKLGDEKVNYFLNYFEESQKTRKISNPNVEYSLNRKEFREEGITREDVNIYFEYLEELAKSGPFIEEMPDDIFIYSYYFNDTQNEEILEFKDTQKYKELVDISEHIKELGLNNFEDINMILSLYLEGMDIPANIEDAVKNNKDELERIIQLNETVQKELLNSNGRGFEEFITFIHEVEKEMKKMEEKEFIIDPTKDFFAGVFNNVFPNSINYTRIIQGIAILYAGEGKYKEAIDILVNYQLYLEDVFRKSYRVSMSDGLFIVTMLDVNISIINYFVDNYNLPKESLDSIYFINQKELKPGVVEGAIKNDYLLLNNLYENKNNMMMGMDFDFDEPSSFEANKNDNYTIRKILFALFYSEKETLALHKKYYYDIINNKGENGDFYNQTIGNPDFKYKNINNIIGKALLNAETTGYESQYKKEQDMIIKRQELIEKLKNNLGN